MIASTNRVGLFLLTCALLLCPPLHTRAQQHDGTHDFDWDIGTWKIHQRRLMHPLTGSTTWVEYDGTDAVQRIWDGANMGKVESDGPAGHLEVYTLRLYDPESHQWNIYFTNPAGGKLSLPVVGQFSSGRGEFYDQEPYNGRTIMVRFRVYNITRTSCTFDQAFSADGGKTWETNFLVTETLEKPGTTSREDRATSGPLRSRRA